MAAAPTPSRRARGGRLAPRPPPRPSQFGKLLRRLLDPADTRAAVAVAVVVLLGEALLTGLIIRRVPGEWGERGGEGKA